MRKKNLIGMLLRKESNTYSLNIVIRNTPYTGQCN